MKPSIRKATLADRPALHEAHMRSIREVCVKDHGDEIRGWGNGELGERWISGINNGLVWVVDRQGEIFGLAALIFSDVEEAAHIQALYLTPEVLDMGFGKSLMELMLNECRLRNVVKVTLDSTLTAHAFYEKYGFRDTGPAKQMPIGGVPVTGIPMSLSCKS